MNAFADIFDIYVCVSIYEIYDTLKRHCMELNCKTNIFFKNNTFKAGKKKYLKQFCSFIYLEKNMIVFVIFLF